MKTIQIEYFAILREQAGQSRESVRTEAPTAAELFANLQQTHGFAAPKNFKLAVNDEFCAWDTPLNDGDRVVFIPPVAGG
jgi:molybdopterin converting factor subunit 1